MPARVWPLWSLTGLLLLGFPVINFIYWPQVLRSGGLPPDGDTIAIPMFGSLILAFVAHPFVLGIAWFCFRRYNPATRLMTWRGGRLLRSAVATIVFAPPAVLLAIGALEPFWLGLAWHELLLSAYAALCACWLLALRAAVIDELENE